MWNDNPLIELLKIEHPILQAPMAGATNPELVAAVCGAGGLGGLGAADQSSDDLRNAIREIRQRTDRPFNINLFNSDIENFDRAARPGPQQSKILERYHSELGLGPLPSPTPLYGPAEDQLRVLLEERVPVISFHFGVDAQTVARAKECGARVLCTATTLREARMLEEAGVDAIIAQGSEAGGHRGTFDKSRPEALICTMALVPRIADEVSVPIIAAGGIMDARGVVAALALGASAAQLGTAFLGCREAPVAPDWRDALDTAEAESTVVTDVLSGRSARGLRNRFIEEMAALDEPLLAYPAQYAISRELRKEAAKRQDRQFAAMWVGQGVGLFKRQPAAELVAQIVADCHGLIERLLNPR